MRMPRPIGELIIGALPTARLRREALQERVRQLWPRMVGKALDSRTSLGFSGSALVVCCADDEVRALLEEGRERLERRLSELSAGELKALRLTR